jgi:hypothetical protein
LYLGSNFGAFGGGFKGGAAQRRAISLEFSKNQTRKTLKIWILLYPYILTIKFEKTRVVDPD